MDDFDKMREIEAQIEKDFDEIYSLLCDANDAAEDLDTFVEAAKTLGLDILAEELEKISDKLIVALRNAEPWVEARATERRYELGWPEWAKESEHRR